MPDDLEFLRCLPTLDVDARTARRIERRLREGPSLRGAALSALLATTTFTYLAWAIAFTSNLGILAR
ncbi:MAG: hypothetical protein ACXWUG_10755 [Polyangiales bacterium]